MISTKALWHYIKKNTVATKSIVAVRFSESARFTVSVNVCESAKTIVRNKHFIKMESTLALGINNCKKKNIPLSGNNVQETQKLYQ